MAKLNRVFHKIFGRDALDSEVGKFGSLAAGSPQNTKDVSVIQDSPEFNRGWGAAVVGRNSPAIEERNALDFLNSRQLAYLFQQGVAEWNSETTYYVGSVVQTGSQLFVSRVDDNLDNNPIEDISEVNWQIISSSNLYTVVERFASEYYFQTSTFTNIETVPGLFKWERRQNNRSGLFVRNLSEISPQGGVPWTEDELNNLNFIYPTSNSFLRFTLSPSTTETYASGINFIPFSRAMGSGTTEGWWYENTGINYDTRVNRLILEASLFVNEKANRGGVVDNPCFMFGLISNRVVTGAQRLCGGFYFEVFIFRRGSSKAQINTVTSVHDGSSNYNSQNFTLTRKNILAINQGDTRTVDTTFRNPKIDYDNGTVRFFLDGELVSTHSGAEVPDINSGPERARILNPVALLSGTPSSSATITPEVALSWVRLRRNY